VPPKAKKLIFTPFIYSIYLFMILNTYSTFLNLILLLVGVSCRNYTAPVEISCRFVSVYILT
jgi:hypothetical protein